MREKVGKKPMMKAFSFFAFMFVGTSMLLSVMAGGGGGASTLVNDVGGITVADLIITVDTTTPFADEGVMWIDYEQIRYTSKGVDHFHVPANGRGWNDTEAIIHPDNALVRAEDNAILNSVFGFDVGQLVDSWGILSFPIVLVRFFSQTVPYMMQGNMGNLFQGNGLAFVVNLWLVFGVGFIFMLVMALIGARRQ
jgi:hypothetical protein